MTLSTLLPRTSGSAEVWVKTGRINAKEAETAQESVYQHDQINHSTQAPANRQWPRRKYGTA